MGEDFGAGGLGGGDHQGDPRRIVLCSVRQHRPEPSCRCNTYQRRHKYVRRPQVPLNTWTHLTNTYDGTTLRLYVNGTEVINQAVTGSMPVSASPLRIDGDSVWGEYLNGLIDEVRIYNRALTAAEIQADMNAPIK